MIRISYRRSDSEAIVGRIFDRLTAHYGKDAIFRDADDIPTAVDFRHDIREALLKTRVLLVIVGPQWLGAGSAGRDGIGDEFDPVRIEVETALQRRVPTIPVLIGATRMPGSEHLPASLRDFAFRNAIKVDTGRDFDYHMDRLIKAMDSLLGQTASNARRESGGSAPPGSGALPIAALMRKRSQARPRINVPTPAVLNASTADRKFSQTRSQSGLDTAEAAPSSAVGAAPPDYQPVSEAAPSPFPVSSRRQAGWRQPAVIIGAVLAAAAAYVWRHDLAVAVAPILKLFGSGSTPAAPIPAAPEPTTPANVVDVSAFAPTTARTGEAVLVQILLHAPEARATAAALAQEADPDAEARGVTTLAVGVQHGQRVDIVLDATGSQIDEASQSLVWQGQPRSCQFALNFSAELAGRNCMVKARVLAGSIPVGALRFTIKVTGSGRTTAPDLVGEVARRYRQAFLSHSHEDRVAVLTYAQLLDAIGIKYFQDIASLRTMEDWEPRLHSAIDECDLFLLFWTASASRSEWVERETRYAMARQKKTNEEIPDVMPVFLEPEAPEPPDWIKSRHFDSLLRLAMRGAQADLLARRSKS